MLNDPRSHGLGERTASPLPLAEALSGSATADVAVVVPAVPVLAAILTLGLPIPRGEPDAGR